MSFTSEIRDFPRARLRTTVTNVTRLDGSKWVETRPSDQHGYVVCRSPGDSCGAEYGYVADVAPDLQIGWILPNLLLGRYVITRCLLVLGTLLQPALQVAMCAVDLTNRVSFHHLSLRQFLQHNCFVLILPLHLYFCMI